MAKKKPHVVQRDLPCALSDAEKAELSEEMASAELSIEKLKGEVQALNTEKRGLQGHLNALAHSLDDGAQDKSVECHWVEDMAKNVKRLVRQDTGDVVDESALTLDDRMDDLPGTEGNVTSIADATGGKGGKPKPPKK